MNDEQQELFQVENREWRIITTRGRDENQMPTSRISLATKDDEFTRDSKVPIEYYSDYFILDPHISKSKYVENAIAVARAIHDNDQEFPEPERWYVKQVEKHPDRLIMHRFCGVPLPFFWRLWRRPLEPANITVEEIPACAMVKFSYFEETDPLMSMCFECYLDWDGLFDNLKDKSPRRRINDWWKTMHGRLYLFSDYDSVFEDTQDEIAYIADFT